MALKVNGPTCSNRLEFREIEKAAEPLPVQPRDFLGGSIRRVKRRILLARVNPTARAKYSARVLPNLTPPVPMKAKLRECRSHGARLLLLKLNPNPFADNLAQFPKARRLVIEHVQNFRCRKSAIVKSLPEINPMQLF
jgi:hypothetical protein